MSQVEASPVHVDFRNVQATIVSLHRLPIARHLLFRFGAAPSARAFLGVLGAQLTMADFSADTTPDPLLNLGLTFHGLEALEVPPAVLEQLDAIYREGPDGLALGDVAGTPSDPAGWWERGFATDEVHGVVHLYAHSQEALDSATEALRALATEYGVGELRPRADGTVLDSRSLGGAKLHFGYTDGISHPDISWDDVPDTPSQVKFRNFLLGYATPEYSSAPEGGPAADFVRDSAYGVLRWIYQDVATFNAFLGAEAARLFPELPAADGEELLAAKLMGRWRDGTPLVLSPEAHADELSSANDFGYLDEDPGGVHCPFASHVRVMNPRDQPLDPVVRHNGVPRVIRRGMPYGAPLEGTVDDGADRGIVGIFLCADIRRQIYTLMGWIRRTDFSPVYDPDQRRRQDAVVGNRSAPGADKAFTFVGPHGRTTIPSLPDFVHTKGTLFLLYPSGSTLARLSAPA